MSTSQGYFKVRQYNFKVTMFIFFTIELSNGIQKIFISECAADTTRYIELINNYSNITFRRLGVKGSYLPL